MPAKEFDFKRFLVQRGERLGAGIAAAVMVLLLGKSAASGLRSERPSAVIQQIRGLAAVIEDRIITGDSVSDAGLDPRLVGPRIHEPISAAAFKTNCDYFLPVGLEDDKRRNPSALTPVEFQTDVLRLPVRNLIVVGAENSWRVGVLVTPEGLKNERPPSPHAHENHRRQTASGSARPVRP